VASIDLRGVEHPATRIQDYRALLAVPGSDLTRDLLSAFQSLPFKLGESEAEAAIPYAFDDAFVEAAERAIDDLTELLRRRREAEAERAGPRFVEIESRRIAPFSYSLTTFSEGAAAGTIAGRAVRLDPTLDSGLLETWLVRGQGAGLFEQLTRLLGRACEEDLRTGGLSHVTLAWTAALDLFESRKARAKGLVSRLSSWERIEKTIGFACYALSWTALEAALAPTGGKRLAFDVGAWGQRVRTLLTPLAWCSLRAHALQNDMNPWGISQALAEALDSVWLDLLDQDPNPRTAEQRLHEAVLEDTDLKPRVARAAAIALARRHALAFLAIYESLDPSVSRPVAAMVVSDQAIFTELSNPKAMLSALQKFGKGRKADPAGEAATAVLCESLRRGIEREDALGEMVSAYTCLALDRVVAGALDQVRTRLRDRRIEYTREQLIADYVAGRLYRLSSDGREVRRSLAKRSEGHLFIDLKGFSQRTCRAKEIVMADFLRSEFYEPILTAASSRALDEAGHPRIALQNLLGDAAVFSGEMAALVDLAQAIQKICRAYADKLRKRSEGDPKALETRKLETEARVRGELERLREELSRAEAALQRKLALSPAEREQMLFTDLSRRVAEMKARRDQALARQDAAEARRASEAVLALEQHEREVFGRVENLFGANRDEYVANLLVGAERQHAKELQRRALETRRAGEAQLRALEEELRSHHGYGLEAGLFITYGATAEVAQMNDPVFGRVGVAIAERINEAARGTARNASLKAKLEGLLAQARLQTGRPGLGYPFRVHVDSSYSVLLPAELAEAIDAAVREKDPAAARDAAKRIADTVLRDLARTMGMGDGQPPEALGSFSDIYNTGEALSGEAVSAYLTETASTRFWFRKTLCIAELHAEFRELFHFLSDELELIVSVPHSGDIDSAVVFRRAGEVQFRGFEGKPPTSVYELLRPDSPFYLLLQQRHLGLWTEEARGAEPPADLPS